MTCARNGRGGATSARGAIALVLTLVLSSCASEEHGPSPAASASAVALPEITVPATGESETTESEATETETPEDDETEDDDSEDGETGETSLAGGSYEVTITGAAGQADFEREGTVRVLDTISEVGTTNEVNVVDVCLVSGFPAAQPEAGAIWLGSNSGCDPDASAAHIDLAYVETDGRTVTVRPDERVAATLGNNFTAGSGLAAGLYAPVSGQMSITIDDDGDLSGTVDIVGYGGAGFGEIRYQAEISGHRA
ncbi:hypothetical protein [Microbispora amethystogenes]|uniref:DUF4352 domain-containing protein n=1 Tax=Microbispora amethystogenes TaxID=1427754 RepID=A0ABQ4F8A0_9ACTN|nr:hypothetical protein [Microbispora amethystogenes]GIH31047.1 hypothetical protein Mam01_12110 [Microbispora amethystogenes]